VAGRGWWDSRRSLSRKPRGKRRGAVHRRRGARRDPLTLWREGLEFRTVCRHELLAARWVEGVHLELSALLPLCPAEARQGALLALVRRADLVATIMWNGQEIEANNNSFTPCRIDAPANSSQAKNILTVPLGSGLFYAAEKPVEGGAWGPDAKLHKSPIGSASRNAKFSWDWSTRLINVGITNRCRLEWTTGCCAGGQALPLPNESRSWQAGKVRARLFAEGWKEAGQKHADGGDPEAGRKVSVPERSTGVNPV